MIKKCLLNFIVWIFFSLKLSGQNSNFGSWFIYFGNQKIKKNWNFQSDVQFRNYQIFNQRNQLLIRGGLGYNLSPQNHNLLLGIAYVESYNYD